MTAKKADESKEVKPKKTVAKPEAVKKAAEADKKNKKAETIAEKVFGSVATEEPPKPKEETIPEVKFVMKPPNVKPISEKEILNPMGEMKFSAFLKKREEDIAAAIQSNRQAAAVVAKPHKFKTLP